jgi:hypothetical protein
MVQECDNIFEQGSRLDSQFRRNPDSGRNSGISVGPKEDFEIRNWESSLKL